MGSIKLVSTHNLRVILTLELSDFIVKIKCHYRLLKFTKEGLQKHGCNMYVSSEINRLPLVDFGLELFHGENICRSSE